MDSSAKCCIQRTKPAELKDLVSKVTVPPRQTWNHLSVTDKITQPVLFQMKRETIQNTHC